MGNDRNPIPYILGINRRCRILNTARKLSKVIRMITGQPGDLYVGGR
jgi:hypothetical protein